MKKEQGSHLSSFTLAELLIVIAILAILAVIAFQNYKSQTEKAFDKKRKDHLNRLKVAFEDYYNDHNCYPSSDSLDPCGEGAEQLQPYLRIIPCDPGNNQPYVLATDNDACPQKFKIYTTLGYENDLEIEELGCLGGCGPSAGDYVDGSSIENNDYTYNYGVSSTNEEIGCQSNYYSGWRAGDVLSCEILSSNGEPPDCSPYFCGMVCGEPQRVCK